MPNATNVATLEVRPKSERYTYKGEVITVSYIMEGKDKGKFRWHSEIVHRFTMQGVADTFTKAKAAGEKEIDKLRGT